VTADLASTSLDSTRSSLGQLAGRLGVQWNQLAAAATRTGQKKSQLSQALTGLDSADTSIVAFGSLARNEFTQGSDIDWTLLIDGQAASEHLAIANKIRDEIAKLEGKEPGGEGIFGNLSLATRSFIRSEARTTRTRTPHSASSCFWNRACSASQMHTIG
jgi:predicted nucleotidyltransferase